MREYPSLHQPKMKRSYLLPLSIFLKIIACYVWFFLSLINTVYGQKAVHLDSLESVYKTGKYDPKDELKILDTLATDTEEPSKKLTYSLALIEKSETFGATKSR